MHGAFNWLSDTTWENNRSNILEKFFSCVSQWTKSHTGLKMSWEWVNDDRMIIFLLKYSFKLFSKYILTDTLPSGRLSLPLSSFQIILFNLVCLYEVRKINANAWDDKHHDPKTIFSPLHYRHCYATTLFHVRSRHSRTLSDSEHCLTM